MYSIAFIVNGYNIIAAAYFTSLGEAKTAALISTLRSLALVTIFVLMLPQLIGNAGIWLTAPCTEVVTFLVAAMYVRHSKTKLLQNTQAQPGLS